MEQEIVDLLPHTPETDAAVEPTDHETGLTEGSHCAVCGEVLIPQETIPANYDWDGDIITGYNREEADVVIPADATGIGDGAFADKGFIRTVTMGDNITFIGARAFSGCFGLMDVYLPDSLNVIGEDAFFDC